MVYKIYKKGNYVIIVDANNNYIEESSGNVLITKASTTSTAYNINLISSESIKGLEFADIRDESNVAYASQAIFETWYTSNTGFNPATSASVTAVANDLDTHEANTSNPHSVTKTQVGLSNVDNTSDANKPVSTAQQTALDLKLAKTESPSILDWSASTAVRANEIRIATVSIDGVIIGSQIRSNSARTTGATFDLTEAGNWTMVLPYLSVTSTQRRAIASPRNGQMVYDTDLRRNMMYNGTIWTANGIVEVINKSGVDQTANNWNVFVWDLSTAFGVVRTTVADNGDFAGILVDGAVNNGTMTIVTTGVAKVQVVGAVTPGDNLASSTTIGKAFDGGTAYVGTFGKAQSSVTDGLADMTFNYNERF